MPRVVVLGNSAVDLITKVQSFPKLNSHVDAEGIRPAPGGKGLFQAVACRKLGCFTTFVTSLGQDMLGQGVKGFLEQQIQSIGPIGIPNGRDQGHLLIHELPTDLLGGGGLATSIVYVIFDPGQVAPSSPARQLVPTQNASYTAYNVLDRGLADFIAANAETDISAADAVLISFDMDQRSIEKAVRLATGHHRQLIIHASPPKAVPLELIIGAKYLIMTRREALEWLRLRSEAPQAYSPELPSDRIPLEQIAEPFLRRDRTLTLILIEENDNCAVIDRTGARCYAAYPASPTIGFNGVRSAFCAAITTMVAHSSAQSVTVDETDLMSFGAAAIHYCRVVPVSAGSLPDMDALRGIVSGFGKVASVNCQ